MLALWMFGVELERMWGTPYFMKYYFVTGIGAALVTSLVSFAAVARQQRITRVTIGASGAVYGVLLAYGDDFPNRPIYLYFCFRCPRSTS